MRKLVHEHSPVSLVCMVPVFLLAVVLVGVAAVVVWLCTPAGKKDRTIEGRVYCTACSWDLGGHYPCSDRMRRLHGLTDDGGFPTRRDWEQFHRTPVPERPDRRRRTIRTSSVEN